MCFINSKRYLAIFLSIFFRMILIRYTGLERILFKGGNGIISNRRYDEFNIKWKPAKNGIYECNRSSIRWKHTIEMRKVSNFSVIMRLFLPIINSVKVKFTKIVWSIKLCKALFVDDFSKKVSELHRQIMVLELKHRNY